MDAEIYRLILELGTIAATTWGGTALVRKKREAKKATDFEASLGKVLDTKLDPIIERLDGLEQWREDLDGPESRRGTGPLEVVVDREL